MTHPAPVQRLPDIDPAEHALESRSWGEEFTFHLVSYDGRYYAWTVRPWDDGDHAYEMPSRQDARQFLDSEFAFLLTVTDWGERVASAHVGDGATGQILFSADVLDGAEDGIWLATSEADGEESTYALAGFDDLGAAVAAFAARSEQAADAIERLDIGWPRVAAGYLRYRAALARAGAARAVLGDTIRRSRSRIRAERAVSRVAGTVDVSREFLYHILAGDDWTWKGLMPARKDVLPPRPPARLDPATLEPPTARPAWSAGVMFAIDAGSEQEARAIAGAVLDEMGVTATILGDRTGPVPEGLWTVTADVDLGNVTVEPDSAENRLSYLARNLEGVTWVSKTTEDIRAVRQWPPDIWGRQAGADDVLVHPAIRAVRIWASADEAT
jgi:hypothetical protein